MKGIFRSKTFWAGVVFVGIGALQQASKIPELGAYQDLLVSIAGLAMVGLRLISDNKKVTVRHPTKKG